MSARTGWANPRDARSRGGAKLVEQRTSGRIELVGRHTKQQLGSSVEQLAVERQ